MEVVPLPLSRRRRSAIAAVKGVHTVIFAVEAASVVHIFAAGLLNRPSRWTRFALVATVSEVALMLLTRWRCPLTDLAEWLGADSGRVSDIFLPRWFADRIPQIFTPLLFAGLTGLAWHRLRESAPPSRARD